MKVDTDLIFEPRKVQARCADGSIVALDQLATFVGRVKDVGFRFRVLRSQSGLVHLHLRSTRTAVIPVPKQVTGSWKQRGEAALARFIGQAGEDKVFDVLRTEERRYLRSLD